MRQSRFVPQRFSDFIVLWYKKRYQELFTPRRGGKAGPKGPTAEVINAVIEIKRCNPSFGCPRIAVIINRMFATEVNKDVVRRILVRHYCPESGDGLSWLTFLGRTKDSLWSIDLFRSESLTLRSHWVMVVMDQFTCRIIGFAVHAGDVDGPALCQIFNAIISGNDLPRYLSHDHSPLFDYYYGKPIYACLRLPKYDLCRMCRSRTRSLNG